MSSELGKLQEGQGYQVDDLIERHKHFLVHLLGYTGYFKRLECSSHEQVTFSAIGQGLHGPT
jgi:hypothetical protein